MGRTKIAISIEEGTLHRIDRLVESRMFPSRSRAIETAVQEKIERVKRRRLARECAKLDSKWEKALAEEGLSSDWKEWPEY